MDFGRGKPTFPGRGGPWRGWFLIAAGQSCVTNVASPIPSAPCALAAIRTAACRISVEVQRLRLRWRTPVADGWRRHNTTPSHSSHSGTRFQKVKKNRKETWFEKVSSGERCRIEGTRAVLGWGRRQGRFLQTLGFVGIPRGKPLDNFFGGWYILTVSGVALGPDRGRVEGSPGGGAVFAGCLPRGAGAVEASANGSVGPHGRRRSPVPK